MAREPPSTSASTPFCVRAQLIIRDSKSVAVTYSDKLLDPCPLMRKSLLHRRACCLSEYGPTVLWCPHDSSYASTRQDNRHWTGHARRRRTGAFLSWHQRAS